MDIPQNSSLEVYIESHKDTESETGDKIIFISKWKPFVQRVSSSNLNPYFQMNLKLS